MVVVLWVRLTSRTYLYLKRNLVLEGGAWMGDPCARVGNQMKMGCPAVEGAKLAMTLGRLGPVSPKQSSIFQHWGWTNQGVPVPFKKRCRPSTRRACRPHTLTSVCALIKSWSATSNSTITYCLIDIIDRPTLEPPPIPTNCCCLGHLPLSSCLLYLEKLDFLCSHCSTASGHATHTNHPLVDRLRSTRQAYHRPLTDPFRPPCNQACWNAAVNRKTDFSTSSSTWPRLFLFGSTTTTLLPPRLFFF